MSESEYARVEEFAAIYQMEKELWDDTDARDAFIRDFSEMQISAIKRDNRGVIGFKNDYPNVVAEVQWSWWEDVDGEEEYFSTSDAWFKALGQSPPEGAVEHMLLRLSWRVLVADDFAFPVGIEVTE